MKSTSHLQRSIREYCAGLLDGNAPIIHREAAQSYIADHGDVIGFAVEAIVEEHIAKALKSQSQQPAAPIGQGVLLDLPAAITIADGVTKPLKACTWSDLKLGREYKVANVAAAQESLRRYDQEMNRLRPILSGAPDLTVADAAIALAGAA